MADNSIPKPTQFSDGRANPMAPTMIQRAMQGLRYAFTGKPPEKVWFGPLEPLPSVVPPDQMDSVRGRMLDYQVGVNARTTPRADAGEAVSFAQMRALADSCDVLRLVIETRKDQMDSQSFSVVPIDETVEPDSRCKEVEDFFKLPDGENEYSAWQRMILEEMFVVDAVAIYPWLRNDGSLYRLDLMDGTTIKRVVNAAGRTPLPPDPAYQQVLKGVPAVPYTSDELIYAVRNKRVHKLYGYSPVEQIIVTVNTAIRRAIHQLQFYTEGSTPDLLFSCPSDWNMDQVRDFNDWWQSMLAGNTANRRAGLFIPNGVAPINTKDGALTDRYDEWLARIVCYAFSVSPTPFVAQVNRATAESAQEAALMEGLHPVMKWMKGLLDLILWRYFGYTDLHVKWDENKSIDPAVQAQINDTKVKNGTKTINEARADDGMDPVEGGDKPLVFTPTGPVELAAAVKANTENLTNPPPPPEPTIPGGGATPDDEPPQGSDGKKAKTKANSGNSEPIGKGEVSKGLAKKAASRIDRDRPAMRKAFRSMKRQVAKHLQAGADAIIPAVVAAYDAHGKPAREVVAKALGLQGGAPMRRSEPRYASACGKSGCDCSPTFRLAKSDNPDLDALVQAVLDQLRMDDAFEEMEGSVRQVLQQVLKDSGVQALSQLELQAGGEDALALANESAITWAQERAAELVKGVTEATREMLRSDIEDAMAEGWSNDRLASELEDNYAFSPERAETIARTETAYADVQGNLQVYRASGQVSGKKWITGDNCCDDCDALDGQVVGLDEQFDDGSDDGLDGPPAHPNCRCDVVPVLAPDTGAEDDTEDDEAED